jgi:hypothetical protein
MEFLKDVEVLQFTIYFKYSNELFIIIYIRYIRYSYISSCFWMVLMKYARGMTGDTGGATGREP